MQKLIIIRGPSGSGKSTVAQKLVNECVRPTLLVSEDQFRLMFNDHQKTGHEVAKEMSTGAVLLGLKNGYDVIYEGILNVKTSGNNLENFFQVHPSENYLFYLDVGYGETLRRHKTRPEKTKFTTEAMKRWWDYASPTGYTKETIIPESSSLDETIMTISKIAKVELK